VNPHEEHSERRRRIREDFRQKVLRDENRKIKGKRDRDRGVWFGLGMFGLIGWSVAIPALTGLALGAWADTRADTPYSWTLMGLVLGVLLGCFNAWYWVKRELNRDGN
jgi:ATP synthase protein I